MYLHGLSSIYTHAGFHKWGYPPIAGWFIVDNPIYKWMIWGYPYFRNTYSSYDLSQVCISEPRQGLGSLPLVTLCPGGCEDADDRSSGNVDCAGGLVTARNPE